MPGRRPPTGARAFFTLIDFNRDRKFRPRVLRFGIILANANLAIRPAIIFRVFPCVRMRAIPANMLIQLSTHRLYLRNMTAADAPTVFERYARSSEVCRFLSWTPHQTVDDTLRHFESRLDSDAADRSCRLLIFSRDTDELLGSIGGIIEGKRMQFGYCLARDAWGRGIATEATTAFVASMFQDRDLWRMEAFCDVENKASTRVLEKSGLRYEGTLRRYMILPNLGDEPRDMMCYGRVRDDR